MYTGENSRFAAIPRTSDNKIDLKSQAAIAYINGLKQEQSRFLAELSSSFERSVAAVRPDFQFQHAFNGLVLRLTAEEAERIRKMPDVALVEQNFDQPLNTDAGPGLASVVRQSPSQVSQARQLFLALALQHRTRTDVQPSQQELLLELERPV